jgi:ATP-dependent helicase/nuclease subunit A
MTIHRAKGLEFEIVCVADLGRTPRRSAEILRVSDDRRLGLRLARPGTGRREPALHYKVIGDEQRLAEEREERRLFYVAMTRARERLILSGAAKFDQWPVLSGGGPMIWIAPSLIPDLVQVANPLQQPAPDGLINDDRARVSLSILRPEDLAEIRADGPRAEPAGDPPSPASIQAAETPTPLPRVRPAPPVESLSYSSLRDYARCGYRFYAERVLGLPQVAQLPGEAERSAVATGGAGAAERGVLIHELLARLDFRRPVLPSASAIAATALRAGLAAPSAREAEELVELMRGFAATELCARLGRAKVVRREERFGFLLSSGILVTGGLDVLAREHGNRLLVVDYKSDRLHGGDPTRVVQSAYATQQLVYALAALRWGTAAAVEVEVEVAHCFLELPHLPIVASFTRNDMPRLERELAGLTDGVLRREFDVAQEPYRRLCAGCPAEGGLCSWPLEVTRRETPDQLF